ncbi:MAG: phosphoribosyltransferase [Arcanobacterium sp.]|nr:phosphoribosyltransferase [Arcanobacterium sp.]MDY6142909.1 phosphoribosyltransferase [Arcanobacterium sp.]
MLTQDQFAALAPIVRNVRADVWASCGVLLPSGRLCDLCSTPVDVQYQYCYSCQHNIISGGYGDALDGVVPYTFAVNTGRDMSQWYYDVKNYKASAQATPSLLRVMQVVQCFAWHLPCIRLAFNGIDCVAVVPSTQPRPFHWLVNIAPLWRLPVVPVSFTGDSGVWRQARTVIPGMFTPGKSITGKRVLLLDDSWVTGRSLVSVAYDLKQLGAASVVGAPIARILRSDWKVSRQYLEEWASSGIPERFDPSICPVNGQHCTTLVPF